MDGAIRKRSTPQNLNDRARPSVGRGNITNVNYFQRFCSRKTSACWVNRRGHLSNRRGERKHEPNGKENDYDRLPSRRSKLKKDDKPRRVFAHPEPGSSLEGSRRWSSF